MDSIISLLCRISALVICYILIYRCKLPWKWVYVTILALHSGLVLRVAIDIWAPDTVILHTILTLFNSVMDIASMILTLHYTKEYFSMQDSYSKRAEDYVAALYLTEMQKEFIKNCEESKNA